MALGPPCHPPETEVGVHDSLWPWLIHTCVFSLPHKDYPRENSSAFHSSPFGDVLECQLWEVTLGLWEVAVFSSLLNIDL